MSYVQTDFKVIGGEKFRRMLARVISDALQMNKGKQLDMTASMHGVKRQRGPWYWPFKESDAKLRARILEKITCRTN